jgi:hypothetical protein
MSNPLDGLFRDDESSSSSSEAEQESVADMILRAVQTLNGASGFENRWIADQDRHFFYNSVTRKLICHTHERKYLEYRGEGRYIPIPDPTTAVVEKSEISVSEGKKNENDHVCWVTVIPHDHLVVVDQDLLDTKRKLVDNEPSSQPKISFRELIENVKIPNFKSFLEKWELMSEEPSVRHLLKLDKQLIQYIVRGFNPLRAKPKNALLKYQESLLKHPQKWRIYSVVEEGLIDSGECETTVMGEGMTELLIGTEEVQEGPGIELDNLAVECNAFISKLPDDEYYITNYSNESPVFLDGMRMLGNDGPCPLRDGSVVSIPHKDGRQTLPGCLLLVEIGKPEELMKKRSLSAS